MLPFFRQLFLMFAFQLQYPRIIPFFHPNSLQKVAIDNLLFVLFWMGVDEDGMVSLDEAVSSSRARAPNMTRKAAPTTQHVTPCQESQD